MDAIETGLYAIASGVSEGIYKSMVQLVAAAVIHHCAAIDIRDVRRSCSAQNLSFVGLARPAVVPIGAGPRDFQALSHHKS